MLLRTTFSHTKKFFSKTFNNFKSLVSGGGYQKLPKTPPLNDHHLKTHHQNFTEFDNFYTDFSNKWEGQSDHHHHKPIKKQDKKKSTLIMNHDNQKADHEEEVYNGRSYIKFANNNNNKNPNSVRTEEEEDNIKKKKQRGDHNNDHEEKNQRIMREGRIKLVKQKMRELVMMDLKNMEHVMDVEEMIHYYSRLTCPVYLDMVDNFFTELYSEFFLINSSSSSSKNII